MSTLTEEKWDVAARKAYKALHPDNFAGDGLDYPIKDGNDVKDAWNLARGPEQDAIRAKVKEIAKRLGLTGSLPDTANDEEGTSESVASVTQSSTRPLKKIATLPICWLEYNARSLNGRIYPKATCDAIFKAAERDIADANAEPPLTEPPTTFVSHEDANGNVNTKLVGAPVKVWQEGNKFWANIDLADTSVARDILALVEGRYLRSGSMRVLGVELVQDRNYDLPLVIVQEGVVPKFLGIDLTTRPGLTGVARIPKVMYEANGQEPYTDAFPLTDVQIETQKGQADDMRLPLYLRVALGTLEEAMTDDRKAHQSIHDNLAGVLDATIAAKHGDESARLIALVEAELTEEGKAIAKVHATKIAAAHDAAAHQLGMDCEGAYNESLGIALDPDQDGVPDALDPSDADKTESHRVTTTPKGGNKTLTPEEMMEALKAQGYQINAPKSADELMQERIDAAVKAQLATLTESAATQRQTEVLTSQTEESAFKPEELYQEGDYLKSDLAPKNWRALSDRRVPWPHASLEPKQVLQEMAPFLAYRLNLDEAHARGREIGQFIEQHEQV